MDLYLRLYSCIQRILIMQILFSGSVDIYYLSVTISLRVEIVRVNVNILRWIPCQQVLFHPLCPLCILSDRPPHFLLSFLSSCPLHPFSSSVGCISEYIACLWHANMLEMVSNCFSFVLIFVKQNKNTSIREIPIYVGRHTSWVEEARANRISLSLILQRYF